MVAYLKSLLHRAPLRYFKKYPLVGLDLGFNEIRLLQLEKRPGGFHIEKMLIQPLAMEPSQAGKKMSWEWAQGQLIDLIARSGLMGCPVALALPSSAILKKQIEGPLHLHESELANELQQRMGEYFPGILAKEMYFDFTVPPATEDPPTILLVAARKEQLQLQVEVMEKAGLRAAIVDVDSYALARSAAWFFYQNAEKKDAAAVLLDLCWPVFSFIAFDEADLIFHHQWCVDREVFAEPLLHSHSLIQQVKNAWQLYQATHPKRRIACLGVAGEMTHLEQIAVLLQQQFSLETNVINPFHGMTHSPWLSAETIHHLSARFLLCCGLAMRGPALW